MAAALSTVLSKAKNLLRIGNNEKGEADEKTFLVMEGTPARYSDVERPDAEDFSAQHYHSAVTPMTFQSIDLWERYVDLIDKHPVMVKSITGCIILGMGDLCGQGIEHATGKANYVGVDIPRMARFAVFGLCGAPWSHYYYHFLDKYLPPTPDPFTRTTALKVFIDQGIQAPILLAFMISMLSLLKGSGLNGVRTDMGLNYANSLIANWKLWLPASFLNLAFIEPKFRVLFVNVVFFVWTMILSIMINGSNRPR